MGTVVSVNVGAVAPYAVGTGNVSAIVKAPVEGRVAVRGVNVEGDDQADRRNHGGPDQAVYAYARENYDWWAGDLGRPLAPGTFGENLTLEGIDVDGALIGEQWAIGSVRLAVTAPRIPCLKLATRVGDPTFVKRFAAARRPGAYLRILEEGELGAGDAVEVVSRPSHDVTVRLANEAWLFDHSLLPRLLETGDALAERGREFLAKRV
jgi:MOSC domain-containing protein YiiM